MFGEHDLPGTVLGEDALPGAVLGEDFLLAAVLGEEKGGAGNILRLEQWLTPHGRHGENFLSCDQQLFTY